MKAYQSPLFREEIILELEPELNKAFPSEIKKNSEVFLLPGLKNEDEIILEWVGRGKQTEPVRGTDPSNQRMLRELVDSNLPHLSWVLSTRPKGTGKPHYITIAVRPFASLTKIDETVEIGVDNKIVDDLSRKKGTTVSARLAIKALNDDIFIEGEDTGNDGVSKPLNLAILSDIPKNQTSSKRRGFRIFGRHYAIDVAMPLGSGNMQKLEVVRLIGLPKTNTRERSDVRLCRAHFSFKDSTVAKFISDKGDTNLREIANRAGSYLRLWSDYNDLEKKHVFDRAKKFGFLSYDMFKVQPDGSHVFRVKGSDAISPEVDFEVDSLVVSDELPAHLEKEATVEHLGQTRRRATFYGEFKYSKSKADHTEVTISPPHDPDFPLPPPPPNGVIYLGTRGDEERLARREFAENSIRTGANMPHLMLLLQGENYPIRRSRKIKPLSEDVRKSIGGEPTSRQRDALDIALNTPDIALIQGPPGTGKTRVIAALQKRLSTRKDKQNDGEAVDAVTGSILVTGYQHDAVANVASASEVFGLPAIKVGSKKGLEQEENDGFEKWRLQRVNEVSAQLSRSETPVSVAYREFDKLSRAYVQSPPTPAEFKRMVRRIIDLASPFVEAILLDELQSLTNQNKGFSFDDEEDFDRAQALIEVRGLRTDITSFSDDGADQARRAFFRCTKIQNILSQEELNLLEKASEWNCDDEPDFLSDLQVLKDELVAKLLPVTGVKTEVHPNNEVDAKLQSIAYSLLSRMNSDPAGAEEALFDYYDRLKNDKDGTRRAVERYSVVLAATCQQAVGRRMATAKLGEYYQNLEREMGETAAFESVAFETVVVDEAARASPPDLLIPMSLAKTRIILVGDHRQLPHMLEPEIEKEMEGEDSELPQEILKQSLFERLFKEMQLREKNDGIKRTVTLDVQFRMHPILGAFISNNFYKQYGEEFRSELLKGSFVHGLSAYAQAVAAWIEVPFQKGPESGSISKKRICEAKRIAKEAHAILNERQELSVGVISFYSDQVNELNREMEKLGLVEPIEYSDSYRIAEDYKFTPGASGKIKDRLRVGTVDAFQGMEFDVVILSMTRSNDISCTKENLRRKYGHLVLENRLCVAMSRQKRLLIVAGDSAMLNGEIAAEHLHGLVKFKEMCQGEHGCEIR